MFLCSPDYSHVRSDHWCSNDFPFALQLELCTLLLLRVLWSLLEDRSKVGLGVCALLLLFFPPIVLSVLKGLLIICFEHQIHSRRVSLFPSIFTRNGFLGLNFVGIPPPRRATRAPTVSFLFLFCFFETSSPFLSFVFTSEPQTPARMDERRSGQLDRRQVSRLGLRERKNQTKGFDTVGRCWQGTLGPDGR